MYEKANTTTTPARGEVGTNGGFWKKNTIAIPGRPNPSKVNPSATFQDFEQSVSDVWDINEDETSSASKPSVGQMSTQQMSQLLHHQQQHQHNQKSSPTKSGTSSSMDITMMHGSRRPSELSTQLNSMSLKSTLGTSAKKVLSTTECKKFAKIESLMESSTVELEELRKLAWSGISPCSRAKAWKILCGYLPGNGSRQHEVMLRKKEEYFHCVEQYFLTKDQDVHQDTYRQIHIDIPRMSPVVGLFQQRCVQEIFERILYIWAIRHPASGYVQGINDLVTPFFLVFLQDCCSNREAGKRVNILDSPDLNVESFFDQAERDGVEADSYWCLTTILAGIQDNYTFAQPGIQLKVRQLEELIQRIDKQLHHHLVSHEVIYIQFAFRWMNNILMRELPIKATIRLWDTYLAQADGFSHFHLYVCAAFLIHWKSELMKKTDFHTLLMFLQNLPTAKWGDNEIDLLLAEAYRLSYLFKDAPNHLASLSAALNLASGANAT
jgi:hypothetical protein